MTRDEARATLETLEAELAEWSAYADDCIALEKSQALRFILASEEEIERLKGDLEREASIAVEVTDLEARIEAALALHEKQDLPLKWQGILRRRCCECREPWPCPTHRALTGERGEEK